MVVNLAAMTVVLMVGKKAVMMAEKSVELSAGVLDDSKDDHLVENLVWLMAVMSVEW